MDISTALGIALGWSNASTRSALEKQAERIIEAQAKEIRKLRGPGEYPDQIWQESPRSTFVHADSSIAPASGRGTLAAFFMLVGIFFPPIGIIGLIFVFIREFLWLVVVGCIAVVIFEPLGLLEISVALWIAGTCLWCLLSEISGSRIPAKRKRKMKLPKHSLAQCFAVVFAMLLIPAFVYAAILLSLH